MYAKLVMWTLSGFCGLLACIGGAAAQQDTPSATADVVEIQVGDVPASDQGAEWLRREIASFQEAHPEIRVNAYGIGGSRREHRAISTLPDLAENVIGIESMTGGELSYLVDRELIVPLDKFLPDPDLDLQVFPEGLRTAVTYKGKLWGLPWYAEQPFLVCNWPLFEAAGVSSPPQTWDEFMNAVQRLGQDTNGDGRYDQWGFVVRDANQMCLLWLTMLLQQGVPALDPEGYHVDGPEARQALEWMQRLLALPMVKVGRLGVDETAAMSFETIMNLIKNSDLFVNADDLLFAHIPTSGRKLALASCLRYLCIRKSTPEREKASWELLKWITRRDTPLPEGVQPFTCRLDFVDRPDFKDWAKDKGRNLEVAYHSLAWPIDPAPLLEGKLQAFIMLRDGFNETVQGKVTYEAGLGRAAESCQSVLKPHREAADSFELFR